MPYHSLYRLLGFGIGEVWEVIDLETRANARKSAIFFCDTSGLASGVMELEVAFQ
jgi:hypothetical protein